MHEHMPMDRAIMTSDLEHATEDMERSAPPGHVVRLREWGSERHHLLPRADATDDIDAPHKIRVAGDHAISLTACDGKWTIRAVGSTRLWAGGAEQHAVVLVPGIEVRVGRTLLLVEAEREVRLRAYCQRQLGWGADRQVAVDLALRALRLARTGRVAMVLQGDGDLVPIAHGLHRRVLGLDSPFIVCDPRRTETPASVRSPTNMLSAIAAVAAGDGGSICIRDRRLPKDFHKALTQLIDPGCNVQLYMCIERARKELVLTGVVPMELPPLRLREAELPQIIEEYAKDAIAELEVSQDCFTKEDQSWIRRHARSMGDIEKAARRIVAIRSTANISQAAELLDMAQVSLTRWVGRRPLMQGTRKRSSAA